MLCIELIVTSTSYSRLFVVRDAATSLPRVGFSCCIPRDRVVLSESSSLFAYSFLAVLCDRYGRETDFGAHATKNIWLRAA